MLVSENSQSNRHNGQAPMISVSQPVIKSFAQERDRTYGALPPNAIDTFDLNNFSSSFDMMDPMREIENRKILQKNNRRYKLDSKVMFNYDLQ